MSGRLETRAVFIDTSIFFRRNFDIHSTEFVSLKRLCRAGKVRLFLTDVTVRELEAQIERKFYDFVEPLRMAQNRTRLLNNLGVEIPELKALLWDVETGRHLKALKEQLHAFMSEAATKVLEADTVSPRSVFDLYFGRKPPFGKDKKKHEFPDAFAMAAIGDWCEVNKESIYVISADDDMKAVCDEASDVLLYIESLPKFLEAVIQEETNVESARIRFAKVWQEIEERVREEFVALPMYLEDQDGEVHTVEVHDVSLESVSVISLSQDHADFSLVTEVHIRADIEYADPESVFHDSDTRDYIFLETFERTIDRTLNVPVVVSIDFDPTDIDSNEVTRVSINSDDPVWISVNEPVW